jgi:hypothetical protein
LSTIQLDDDPFLERNEIHNVVSDRYLPSELRIFQLSGSQSSPKEFLCTGLPFSEAPGIYGKPGFVHFPPHPTPLPPGEREIIEDDPLPPEKKIMGDFKDGTS